MSKDNSQRAGKEDYEVGYKKPPKNRQFGEPEGNPRHNGSWHKEDTPRYWIEKFTAMSEKELLDYYNNETNPLFRRRMAKYVRDGDWNVLKDMIEQVYGKMPMVNITAEADEDTEEQANKFIRGFCLP